LELMKTHIYAYHKEHGNIVDFGGWAMPVWYEGIIAEHHAVRNGVGIFDTSHMGRAMAKGPDVEKFVNWVVTNDVSKLEQTQGLYTVMLRPNAGIVDDLITYKMGDEEFFIVYNAANRDKDFNWLKENSEGFDVELTDISDGIAMIAVQGPKAVETLQKITEEDLSGVERFSIAEITVSGLRCMAARTGYTGEDGFEVFVMDCPVEAPEKGGAQSVRERYRRRDESVGCPAQVGGEVQEGGGFHREGGPREDPGGGGQAEPGGDPDGGQGDSPAAL